MIDAVTCDYCGAVLYPSQCPAPGCDGLGCQVCGVGCDLDFISTEDGGMCAAIVDAMNQEWRYDGKF